MTRGEGEGRDLELNPTTANVHPDHETALPDEGFINGEPIPLERRHSMLGNGDFPLLRESGRVGMNGNGGEGEGGGHGGYFDGGKSGQRRREGVGIDENGVVLLVVGLGVDVHRLLRFESEGGVLAEISL